MKKLNPISSHCSQHNICAAGSPLWWYGYFIMTHQSKKQFYKTCSKCGKTKSISEFYKSRRMVDGLTTNCGSCVNTRSKKWQKANPEKHKEHYKKWKEANLEKERERQKNWRKNNPEKQRECSKKWQKANPEKQRECKKNWWKANPEYQKNKKIVNSSYKLKCNIATLIYEKLKKQNYTKQSKTYEILGIKYNEFYEWLNNKANNGLDFNTDNIHLDHVIPVSLGQTEEEILLLNHYSNLQLLSPENNLSKGNTYISKINLNRVLKYHPDPKVLQKIINRSNIKIRLTI